MTSPIRNHYGNLIYITTGSARYTMPDGAIAFAVAKSGLVTFSRYITQKFGRHGITANILASGLTGTTANAYMSKEAKQQVAYLTALGRVEKPEDVAGVVASLASGSSRFVNNVFQWMEGSCQLGSRWMKLYKLPRNLIRGKEKQYKVCVVRNDYE